MLEYLFNNLPSKGKFSTSDAFVYLQYKDSRHESYQARGLASIFGWSRMATSRFLKRYSSISVTRVLQKWDTDSSYHLDAGANVLQNWDKSGTHIAIVDSETSGGKGSLNQPNDCAWNEIVYEVNNEITCKEKGNTSNPNSSINLKELTGINKFNKDITRVDNNIDSDIDIIYKPTQENLDTMFITWKKVSRRDFHDQKTGKFMPSYLFRKRKDIQAYVDSGACHQEIANALKLGYNLYLNDKWEVSVEPPIEKMGLKELAKEYKKACKDAGGIDYINFNFKNKYGLDEEEMNDVLRYNAGQNTVEKNTH